MSMVAKNLRRGLGATNSTACHVMKTCELCYATTGCHFCASDNKCHTYGSAYGCIYGASCESQEGCVRKTPENVSYAGATFGDVVVILFLVGIVATCAALCIWSASLFKDLVSDTKEEVDKKYIRLNRLSSTGENIDDIDEEESSNWIVPKNKVKMTPAKAFWILRCCKVCCFFAVVSSVVIGVLVGINFPNQPTYNVCMENFNWKSILNSFTKFSLQADFDVLLSIKNPNRFDFAVNTLRVDFLHDSTIVGSAHDTRELVLKPHSITDYMLKVSFRPSLTQALSMQQDYLRGGLYFSLNGRVQGYTTPLGWKYDFVEEVEHMELRIGDDADTSLCKCKIVK
eukprot:g2947.t1